MALYRAFGLKISSELLCPELRPAEGHPDVTVRLVSPDAVDGMAQSISGFDAAAGRFELRVPRVGRFVVERGERITITPDASADQDSLRLFLLGTAIGALLQQRATLPLHGSAVWKDGRSLLILGPSGIGKSSLAAALCRNGWQLHSDDISAVNLRSGRAECEPGFPRQKMWPDMLRELGEDATEYDAVRPGVEKRSVPVADAAFHDAPAAVDAIVALSTHRGHSPAFVAVHGPARMAVLKRLTFRANLRAALERHVTHFEIIGRLAEQAQLVRIKRPRIGGSPLALAERVLAYLDSSMAGR